jgi:hypothetical protein
MVRGYLAGMTIAGALAVSAPALAMPESCQKDFAPMMQQRANYMETINGYKKRKPSAPQACNTFGGLASVNRKIVKWMEDQKDWCQVPDEMISQLKGQQGQIDKVRGQACGAAAKQAQMMKQARRAQQQQRQAGPSVGGGVRLPQGAL